MKAERFQYITWATKKGKQALLQYVVNILCTVLYSRNNLVRVKTNVILNQELSGISHASFITLPVLYNKAPQNLVSYNSKHILLFMSLWFSQAVQLIWTWFSHILGNQLAVSSSRMASGGMNQLSFNSCFFQLTDLCLFSCELWGSRGRERMHSWFLDSYTLNCHNIPLSHLFAKASHRTKLNSKNDKQTFSC